MQQLMLWSGNAAAMLGMFCCAVAVITRLSGAYYAPGGAEAMSVFILGTGLMVYACLTKLELLLQQKRGA